MTAATNLRTEFDNLTSSTLPYYCERGTLIDNLSNHNALINAMKKRNLKNLKATYDGGDYIRASVGYDGSGTYSRTAGWQSLDMSDTQVMTTAQYLPRNVIITVVASDDELLDNSGSKQRIFNLYETKLTMAMRKLYNNFSVDLYSDGTTQGQINGLEALISDAGTGTVGGINSTTDTWWQNQVENWTTAGSPAADAVSTIQSDMRSLFRKVNNASVAEGSTDVIIASEGRYDAYYASLNANVRYSLKDDALDTHANVLFEKVPVFYEKSVSGMPADTMFFLNTDYLILYAHKDANFTVSDDQRPWGQRGVGKYVHFRGNLITTNRRLQGKAI